MPGPPGFSELACGVSGPSGTYPTPQSAEAMHSPAAKPSLEIDTISLRQDGSAGSVSDPVSASNAIRMADTVPSEKLGIYDSFDALPGSYADLFEAAGKQSYFFSRSWFENLAKTTFQPHEQVQIFGLETDDLQSRPLACLVMRTPAGQKGSIFSGRGFPAPSLAGLTTHPTTLFSPLVAETVTDPKAVLSRLLSKLLTLVVCKTRLM